MSNCIGCDYYDSSVDCCNCDDYCYMDGIAKGKEEANKDLEPLIKEIHDCVYNEGYLKGRADVIGEIATRLEEELTMVMPRDKVKYVMYKVHTVLERLKEQK